VEIAEGVNMGLSTREEEKLLGKTVEKIIEETTAREIKKAVAAGMKAAKGKYQQTEKRLYAYPVLKRNIERYKKDIEDVKKEDMQKSHDFVIFIKNSGGGDKPDLEELRAAKVLMIEQKISRDQKEIEEIEAALKEIKADEYYKVINLCYFEQISKTEIEERMHCVNMTLWRNRKRLINKLSLSLYGADAI
jgi:hypothetical protein